MAIYLRQRRRRQQSPTGAQKLNGSNVSTQVTSPVPKSLESSGDSLTTGVLDYLGQRDQLGQSGEGKQVLRTLAYFRGLLSLSQLRFLSF